MEGKDLDINKLVKFWVESSDDDYKINFYKLCTENFTTEWIGKIKECRTWIKLML